MAKVVVGAEVEVKTGSAAKSVGDLRKQLKDAQKDVARLSDEFGVTSTEAINAAKKVAQLRDTIQDSKELIDAFNPATKFQAFSGAINTVVGGFTALTGAQALFGEKSEQVEKVLLKVQSALALSQGVSQILDAGGAFNTLAAVIKSKVVTAFGTLRAAIISTGIGALVVGVGLLIANFDKVKQALLNAIPGLSTFFDFVGKVTDKVKEWLGFSEDQLDTQIALKEATEDLTAALSKYYDEIDRVAKLEKLRAQIAGRSQREIEAIDEQATQRKIANIDGLIKLAKEYGIATITLEQERQKLLESLEITRLENQAKEADRQRAISKAEAEKEKARLEALEKFQQGLRNDRAKRDQQDLESLEKLKEGYLAEEQLIANQAQAAAENKIFWEQWYAERSLRLIEEQKAADAALTAQKIANAQSVANSLGLLSDVVGKQTAAGKVLGIAQATINTFVAGTEALKAIKTAKSPIEALAGIATMASVIAAGLRTVKQITQVQVPGSGGGSVPNISAPIAPQLNQTSLDQNSINQLNNAANRSFVLESDISGNQERIRRLNRAARIN